MRSRNVSLNGTSPSKHDKHYVPATEGRLTLYLSEEMVDLDKKVKLTINGKEVFNGKAKHDMKHLINSCTCFFDPQRLYTTGIEVEL